MKKDFEIVYCIDTSALIDMKDKFPNDIFKTLWKMFSKLIDNGRIISSIEVFDELTQGDDELTIWAKKNKKIFLKKTLKQIENVKEILKRFDFLAHPEKEGANADPWLIALVMEKMNENELFSKKYFIIANESKTNPQRIPMVCMAYEIECLNLFEFFRKEGWEF